MFNRQLTPPYQRYPTRSNVLNEDSTVPVVSTKNNSTCSPINPPTSYQIPTNEHPSVLHQKNANEASGKVGIPVIFQDNDKSLTSPLVSRRNIAI